MGELFFVSLLYEISVHAYLVSYKMINVGTYLIFGYNGLNILRLEFKHSKSSIATIFIYCYHLLF
ncbi:MAG: hypothetical protein DRJ05_15620 [Bacteroidetes bacterium]|nr:MAG: hypothetical protein DRJ05_15620 [Bacteroidota bacterium]